MAYIECPQCGHRALSIATRCPHCGVAFPPRPLRPPMMERRPEWLRPALAVAGVLAVGGVVVVSALRRPGSRAPDETTSAMAPGAAGPDSQAAGPAAGSTRPAAPPPAAAAARARSQRQARKGVPRYARTWANVREAPGRSAPSVRVLNPGEVVLVDSLRRGWYRVLADGQTLGYVHRSTLDPDPPTARP